MVIGGKLILPKERRKDDKSLYICKEHIADVENVGDEGSEVVDEEDGLGEMDELETSVMEEEMTSMNAPDRGESEGEDDDDEETEDRNVVDDGNLFSQSLLKK